MADNRGVATFPDINPSPPFALPRRWSHGPATHRWRSTHPYPKVDTNRHKWTDNRGVATLPDINPSPPFALPRRWSHGPATHRWRSTHPYPKVDTNRQKWTDYKGGDHPPRYQPFAAVRCPRRWSHGPATHRWRSTHPYPKVDKIDTNRQKWTDNRGVTTLPDINPSPPFALPRRWSHGPATHRWRSTHPYPKVDKIDTNRQK